VLAFAEGVYRLAAIAKGSAVNKFDAEDRNLLKVLGTDWGREGRPLPAYMEERLAGHKPLEWGSPDIWAKLFVANCRRLPPHVPIFNDDTRFENELRISSAEAGFVPVFIKLAESTRLARLRERGDSADPNDPAHLSEILSNLLNTLVLEHDLLPVVWNDDENRAPRRPWVWSLGEFKSVVLTSSRNAQLVNALGWSETKREHLLAVAFEATNQRAAVTASRRQSAG